MHRIVIKTWKYKKSKGQFFKGYFEIYEVKNTLINLKNNKDISRKEVKLQLSNVIEICTDSLIFLGIENLEGDNIRRQKILRPKLVPLTKDVPTPLEIITICYVIT